MHCSALDGFYFVLYSAESLCSLSFYLTSMLLYCVKNYLKSESTMTVTNETRALTLDACSRLVYPLCENITHAVFL